MLMFAHSRSWNFGYKEGMAALVVTKEKCYYLLSGLKTQKLGK